jgi:hypothetical protein
MRSSGRKPHVSNKPAIADAAGTQAEIARQYRVSQSTVQRIKEEATLAGENEDSPPITKPLVQADVNQFWIIPESVDPLIRSTGHFYYEYNTGKESQEQDSEDTQGV